MPGHGQAPSRSENSCAPVNCAELLERCLNSFELAERILSKFEQTFTGDLALLDEAFTERSSERIAGIAHRLKGASANVAAPALAAVASELERAGRSHLLDEIPALLEDLNREWTRFQKRPPLNRPGVTGVTYRRSARST